MRILVIAAHPDDELLGVAGTICKHIDQGDSVYICMATKSYPPKWSQEYAENKRIESERVDAFLGIKKRFNLGLETAKTNLVSNDEFADKIFAVVEQVKPDRIYTHSETDVHLDHRNVFNATLVAARPTLERKIEILSFETPSSSEWSSIVFSPNLYVDISKYIERKLKAFSIYKSEVKKYPHPRSLKAVKALANLRGVQICVPYAEAFKVVRGFE